jgi:uncharacterized protein YkwD
MIGRDAGSDAARAVDGGGADAPREAAMDCERDDAHRYACCVLDVVNGFRQAEAGLPPLVWHPGIAEAAYFYADFLATRGAFAHGLDGRAVGTRLGDFGVPWSAASENIQRNTRAVWREGCDATLEGWAGSPSHRSAMLDDRWSHAAVGVARDDTWWYAVMNFARL